MLDQPESPRWLIQKERRQEAEASAQRLWGADGGSQLGESSSPGMPSELPITNNQ